MCCLYCLVPPPGYRVWPRGDLGPETDEHYHARVAAALAGLTEAQQKRWSLLILGGGERKRKRPATVSAQAQPQPRPQLYRIKIGKVDKMLDLLCFVGL